MAEKTNNQYPNQKKNDETASVIAGIYGVSARYVRMVMAGTREDEEILAACIEYKAGKNLLLETIKEMVPFPERSTQTIKKQPINEAN